MQPRLLWFLTLGFGTLVLLQIWLGGWLFITDVGTTVDSIFRYYSHKSFDGMIEVFIPHVLLISIALMGLLHFLVFIEILSNQFKETASHLLFILLILDQVSPFGIMMGVKFFVYLKIISFILFNVLLSGVWIMMFRAITQGVQQK